MLSNLLRGAAVEASEPHKLEVVGSNPTPLPIASWQSSQMQETVNLPTSGLRWCKSNTGNHSFCFHRVMEVGGRNILQASSNNKSRPPLILSPPSGGAELEMLQHHVSLIYLIKVQIQTPLRFRILLAPLFVLTTNVSGSGEIGRLFNPER